jgi:hypothetical protein
MKNLYLNILIKQTKMILANMLQQNNTDPQTQRELQWYDTITKQNYFTNNNDTIIQQDRLAMGAPSSGLITEIFLQYIEHRHITQLACTHKLINYWRYVDILIAFDPDHSSLQAITYDFSNLHPNLQFTAEPKQDNTLNYLDISLHKTPTGLNTSIYRKPTFTDTIIPYTSNHPAQHKYAAVRYLYNRLHTYDLEGEERK